MPQRIEQDASRFKQIVRGRIKAHLRKFMQQGELIGRKGKDLVSIPIPQIDLPHFVHDPNQQPGVAHVTPYLPNLGICLPQSRVTVAITAAQ